MATGSRVMAADGLAGAVFRGNKPDNRMDKAAGRGANAGAGMANAVARRAEASGGAVTVTASGDKWSDSLVKFYDRSGELGFSVAGS